MEELFNKLNEKFIAYNWNKNSPRSNDKVTEEIKLEIIEILSNQVEKPVGVQIAEIIDKEIKIQIEVLDRIEKEQKGEAKRQMRLIGTSKRIALEEIKKELLSNLSAPTRRRLSRCDNKEIYENFKKNI